MEALTPMIVMFCMIMAIRQLKGYWRAYQDAQLLERNPEAWKASKQVEANEKDRKRKAVEGTAMTGLKITDWFLRHR